MVYVLHYTKGDRTVKKRIRVVIGFLLTALLALVVCTAAMAAAATAPAKNRISINGPDGLAYTTDYNAAKALLTVNMNAAKTDPAAFRSYAADSWNGMSQVFGLDIWIKPPAGAKQVKWWLYNDGKLSDTQLHALAEQERPNPADSVCPWVWVASYMHDDDIHSIMPTERLDEEYYVVGMIWLDQNGNEIAFEKLQMVAQWDSLAEIPLEDKKGIGMPAEERVHWTMADGLVFAEEPEYNPVTGAIDAVIDTAQTDWGLVIANHYVPSNKLVDAIRFGFDMHTDADQISDVIYGGGVQLGSIVDRLNMPDNLADAYSPSSSASIGRYEEDSKLFFPKSNSLYNGMGLLVKWWDGNHNTLRVPCELLRLNVTFTDYNPVEVKLNPVPAGNMKPDYGKGGFEYEVSSGSVSYVNEQTTTEGTRYETAILVPESEEDTSQWQAYVNGSPLGMVDPDQSGLKRRAAVLICGVGAGDQVQQMSFSIEWKDASGQLKALQVLKKTIHQGAPKLWPEYVDDLKPFPAECVSVSAVGDVDGTSMSYDPVHGIARQVVDSEMLLAAAQKTDLLPARGVTEIRFTPPAGTVKYAWMVTGNSILYGQDIATAFADIQPTPEDFTTLTSAGKQDFGRSQPFFKTKSFELADDSAAEFYFSVEPEYAGSEYGGYVHLYYWYDAEGKILGKNYIAYTYDDVALITQTAVLEDESQLSDKNNGKKKPLIIADGKALGYGQGKLDLRAERSPSSAGTHHYELCLVNDENAEVELKGKGTLYLPYPEGYDETNYADLEITIAHYNADGSAIREVFSIENGTIVPTKHGLRIEVTSLSPFVVSWKEPQPAELKTEAVPFGPEHITEELWNAGYQTPDAVKAPLMGEMLACGIVPANMAFNEVTLFYRDTDGRWRKADKDHFPMKNGKPSLQVLMDLPKGSDPWDSFTVVHMFATSAFGNMVGSMEYPEARVVTVKGKPMLSFTVTGLSPVMIGWVDGEAPAAPPQTGDQTPLAVLLALMAGSLLCLLVLRRKRVNA